MKNVTTVSSMVLLLAGGLALGYFVGRKGSRADDPRLANAEAEAMERLTQAVGTLTTEAGRIREAFASRPAGEPLAVDPGSAAAIAGSIQALGATVDEASSHLESIARSLSRMQDATNPLTVPKEPIGNEVFASLKNASDVDRRIGVHGWSHRQVVETYGAPSRIVPEREGDSERWYYKRPDMGEFIFQFNGDRLVEVIVP